MQRNRRLRFAFFVQRTAANCDERNADRAQHDDCEEDRTKDDEELFHMCVRPDENKMSDGGRDRASLEVEVLKSSQNLNAQRSAVRSIAWLGLCRFIGGRGATI